MAKKSKNRLTHLNEKGLVNMVEVTAKSDTIREAVARGFIWLSKEVLNQVQANKMKKGNVLEVAKIAGILAAKKTSDLIPLCHPLLLTNVEIDLQITAEGVAIESRVVCTGKTGVEMEALTAVSVAALTVYDMCKAVDKTMKIGEICLLKKSGGASGIFINPAAKAQTT
ncbi:MAG: cyclic pyranopterin monophosphate synthase MoaC [bacterium]